VARTAVQTEGVFLCTRCVGSHGGRFFCGMVATDGICAWCGALATDVYQGEINEPQVARYGPFVFSTSLDLDIRNRVIYDTNGYYRDLGVDPHATRAEIRDRFTDIDGWSDEHLTYIARVLLNDDRRDVYDSTPLGDLYFDKYMAQSIEDEILASGQAVMADPDDPEYDDAKSIKKDLRSREDRHASAGPVDKDSLSDQTAKVPTWGYYTWRTFKPDFHGVLAEWRLQVALALRDRGVQTSADLSVGFVQDRDAPWAIRPIGHRLVIFLATSERPTSDHAHAVVESLTLAGHARPND
jgi:hypothetical protein